MCIWFDVLWDCKSNLGKASTILVETAGGSHMIRKSHDKEVT